MITIFNDSLLTQRFLTKYSFVHFIKELDIDKDGKLSREELILGAEKYFASKKSVDETPRKYLQSSASSKI